MTLPKVILLFSLVFSLLSCKKHYISAYSCIRHGGRVPDHLTNDNKDSLGLQWNDLTGLLTIKGKTQLQKLGIWFKNHYEKPINSTEKEKKNNFSSNFAFFISPLNRTIESYMNFLIGLTTNDKTFIYKAVVVEKNDTYLLSKRVCNYTDNITNHLINENLISFYMKRQEIVNKFVLDFSLTNPVFAYQNMRRFWDAFLCNFDYNPLRLYKIFTKNEIDQLYNDISSHSYNHFIYNLIWNNQIKARLYLNYQLKKLLNLFEYHVNSNGNFIYTTDYPRVLINIAHDINLSEFISFLITHFKSSLLYAIHRIDFGSFISFELILDEERFFVNVLYDKTDILYVEYEIFLEKARKFLVSDEEFDRLCFGK